MSQCQLVLEPGRCPALSAVSTNGNRTRMTFPDGNYVTYSYDGLDRPISIQRSGTAAIASYGYNPDGTRASFGSNGSALITSYGYDAIGRLTKSNAVFSYTGRYTIRVATQSSS